MKKKNRKNILDKILDLKELEKKAQDLSNVPVPQTTPMPPPDQFPLPETTPISVPPETQVQVTNEDMIWARNECLNIIRTNPDIQRKIQEIIQNWNKEEKLNLN